MTIYIIILHYGSIKDTISCLESIAKLKKDNRQLKVILVDNNSTSEESLLHKLNLPPSEVMTIKNLQNLGFAGGMNIGIKEALKDKDTDYILILNNDTILPKNFWGEILVNPSDITSPVIKFKFGNKWIYDYGGKINWWTGRTKHVEITNERMSFRAKSRNLSTNENGRSPASAGSRLMAVTSTRPQKWDLVGMTNIDYVSGCCMLVKCKVFEKIGLFDERFFFYFEDVDFCVRAAKLGFRISVCQNTCIDHKLGASIGRWSGKAILYNLYGNLLFITKHLGFRRPFGYLYLFILAIKIFFNKIIGK